MYRVTINNGGEDITVHDPQVNDLKLESGVVKTEINKIDSFNIGLHPNNTGYGLLRPLKTRIKVWNTLKKKYEFEGRVLAPSEDMSDSGLITTKFDCEGELAYLHDSMQRHLEFRGTPAALLETILEYHNTQVESYKHFQMGEMDFTNSTDNLYLYLSAENDTFDTIMDKLVDNIGGELQIRKVDGVRYLDLLEQVGGESSTEIRIAKNLQSMSRDIDPTEVVTRLTPLGTRIESENEGDTDASEARLTIESVNNGVPYIDVPELIEEFGIQGGSITWNDVTLAENLLSKGQGWLASQKTAQVQYKLSAIDLSLIGLDINSFDKGWTYPVINPIMAIDERLRVIGKSTDIINPEKADLTIGDKFKDLEEYQRDANRSARKVIDLENIVGNQTERIGQLLGQVNDVNTEMTNVKQIIDSADLPELNDAIDGLQGAINDLNEALDGIPIYGPVTQTENGLMTAEDKIKLDGLKNYANATETVAGLMSASDKQKVNRISVTQSIDLDQLYQDLQTLMNS